MQFMVLFTRDPSRADEPTRGELREAEFERVRDLYMQGSIRQIWQRTDVAGACAILEATSSEEARQQLSTLPLVRAGLLQPPEIVPLKPYPGFASRGSTTAGALTQHPNAENTHGD